MDNPSPEQESRQAELPRHADVVVIGGGSGGAACAATLAALGDTSVLLIEAGPDYGPFGKGQWPADMLDARSIPLSHDYELLSAATPPLDLPRARILGGCSAHNGCTASIGARYDYDEWATWGNDGWSAADVEPLLDWVHDRFRVRRYGMDELTAPQRAFVGAGQGVGLPFADDLDHIEAAVGIGPMPVNIVDGVRWNSAFAFLDSVRHRRNLEILPGTEVVRLVIEGGRVTGVLVATSDDPHQQPTFIASDKVVVAAGAYHSPALLLRSGIGEAARLEQLGIDVTAELAGVGKHLLDHVCVQLDFAGRPGLVDELSLGAWSPDEQSIGRFRSSVCDPGPYDGHVFMVAGANSGHPGLPPISLYGGAMRGQSEGTVTLAADGSPVIDHRYGTDPAGHDRVVLAEALELLESMVAQPGLAEILGRRVQQGADPLDRIVSYCHPAGSCKMGPASDPAAVVSADGGVHGVPGLYVADASIMPAITRGNINLPTAMIGANIAAKLAGVSPDRVAGLFHQRTLR
ncbi:GMC family oxidoreductase [Kribbella qitaiheensis]|uniref:GMC family oxidoreductase n=1 Tax=Kribbella qitaiheensis TaxID=1544730 RepID=A0A7G6X5D3_9ACTN|nr:GMC family oxidoreductase [Kribbella qitaiheensis]QNE21448.1 GMC family oxidoreductase [Kribbella qitaiheensis]